MVDDDELGVADDCAAVAKLCRSVDDDAGKLFLDGARVAHLTSIDAAMERVYDLFGLTPAGEQLAHKLTNQRTN
jgi:hypothetical protein